MRSFLSCLALWLMVVVPAAALDSSAQSCAELAAYIWEPGYRDTGIAWDAIDVDAALPVCVAAHAENPDDAPTQYRLGRIYLQIKDFAAASSLLRQAAEAGYAPAQTAYGTLYMGEEVAIDYAVALHWLRAAAKAGNPVAMANLGILYYRGYGVAQDQERYVTLQLQAAEAGVDFAQHNAGELFELGYVVKRDLLVAEAWYRLSAAQDYVPSLRNLGLLLNRKPSELANDEEAFQFLRAAADLGDGVAATNVGWMYAEGVGTSPDLALARSYYRQGYERGDPKAASMLGELYEFGKGVPEDQDRAFGYFVQAAWLGDPQAQFRVGVFLNSGIGDLARDEATALEWFLRAAQQGDVEAQIAAAGIYRSVYAGEPSPLVDIDKALYWYEVAARSGSMKSFLDAATLYAGKRDFATAHAYVSYVLDSGDAELIEEAYRTIEVIRFLKQGDRIPI